ncbi:hypothetical protein L2E82_26258 [Cichorium intybus]|uniref:Uncharacterized protein n=1 Tax=Cichorium intybus TaxID=13427 RepID=A0ACB9E5J0_CICIN|nr:hypothetical protein L2E82_26258 [Cichorium intybus]
MGCALEKWALFPFGFSLFPIGSQKIQNQPTGTGLIFHVAACKSAREDGAVDPLQSFYSVSVISVSSMAVIPTS